MNDSADIIIPPFTDVEVRAAFQYNNNVELTASDYYEYGYIRGYHNCMQNDSFMSDGTMEPLTLEDLATDSVNSSFTDSEMSSIGSNGLNTAMIESLGGKNKLGKIKFEKKPRKLKKKGGSLFIDVDSPLNLETDSSPLRLEMSSSSKGKLRPYKELLDEGGEEITDNKEKLKILNKFPLQKSVLDSAGVKVEDIIIIAQNSQEIAEKTGMKGPHIYDLYDIDACNSNQQGVCEPVRLMPREIRLKMERKNPFSGRYTRKKLPSPAYKKSLSPDSVTGIDSGFTPIIKAGKGRKKKLKTVKRRS